jgi:hypothetical protein
MIHEGLLSHQMAPATGAGDGTAIQGEALLGSFGVDLNPDFGLGDQPQSGPTSPTELLRKSPILGMEGDILIRVDVTEDFVAVVGTPADDPALQFHAVLSATQSTSVIFTGTDFVCIGSNVGPFNIEAVDGRTLNGYLAADLTVGKSFFIRLNPWVEGMGRGLTLDPHDARDLRYLGLVTLVTTGAGDGANSYFSDGQVIGRIVQQGDIAHDPEDFIYPSAVSYK